MATSRKHHKSGGQPKSWILNVVRVLLRLVFADVICSSVGEWMVYGLLARKQITKPNAGEDGGLQVIICGMSRSASKSLQEAMDILGFPCFHGMNLMKPTTCNLFMKAYKLGKKEDWDQLLKGYYAISDFPAAVCYKQLMKLYPEAKLILNIRDAHRWYKSYSLTILQGTQRMHYLCPSTSQRCVQELVYNDMFKGKIEDEELSVQIYNLHIQDVMTHVQPSSKLLVYKFGEKALGWAPLCNFLQLEIPHTPFPFSNDTRSFQTFMDLYEAIHIIVIVAYVAFLCVIISLLGNHFF